MEYLILATIRIGGRLLLSHAQILLDAINDRPVYAHVGDVRFSPKNAADLASALDRDGCLELCDDSSVDGDMTRLVEVCRQLGLTYRLWHERGRTQEAGVSTWAPGMEKPASFIGDHIDSDAVLVKAGVLADVLAALHEGRVEEAFGKLPVIPVLPPLELVETIATAKASPVTQTATT